MATPNITDEEIQFRKRARRRLVGAVVLVLLVVVVVPWILPADKPPQETQEIDIRIPAQDATGFAPKVVPAPQPAPGGGSAAATAAPPAAVPLKQPLLSAEAAHRSETPPPAKAAAPAEPAAVSAAPKTPDEVKPRSEAKSSTEVQPKAEAKPAGESFFLQYGAFSEARNAAQKQAELKAKGIATFTEVVKTASGDKIRVRSGPYATREAAERVQQKAKPVESKLVPAGGKG